MLTLTVQRMEARIRDLETRLARKASKSSRPSSKEAPWNKPKCKPPEGSSGRKAGGQAGQVGETRGRLEADEVRDDVPGRYEWHSLWNFVHESGVDSIGDDAESTLRLAVLQRNEWGGMRSDAGSRFVDRIRPFVWLRLADASRTSGLLVRVG